MGSRACLSLGQELLFVTSLSSGSVAAGSSVVLTLFHSQIPHKDGLSKSGARSYENIDHPWQIEFKSVPAYVVLCVKDIDVFQNECRLSSPPNIEKLYIPFIRSFFMSPKERICIAWIALGPFSYMLPVKSNTYTA